MSATDVCTLLSKLIFILRYRDSTASFASLATQTASLSQTPSTLYDKDQPPLSNKASHSLRFSKLKSSTLREERAKYGLKEWEKESLSGDNPNDGKGEDL